ncbi:hypothetical protein, partial [Cupriavidus sp. AcVe19-1a]|uniref:hypothetical protein n=1 Tax=Cupriavidus sp. AcVe19-1a TaxID=2821359 RepID=UPI001AE67D69
SRHPTEGHSRQPPLKFQTEWNTALAGQAGVFALGAACFLAAAIIVYCFGIETRGESLETISAH